MNDDYKNALRAIGVDVDTAIGRVVGKEDLYEKLLLMFFDDKSLEMLREKVAEGNIQGAFDAAHTIKGTAGNLGLDNINSVVMPMVEILRAGNDEGVAAMVEQTQAKYDELKAVIDKYAG